MFCINKYADNRTSIEYLKKTTIPKTKEFIAKFEKDYPDIFIIFDYIFDA